MQDQGIHCPMIHGGLSINLKVTEKDVYFNHCCQNTDFHILDKDQPIWNNKKLIPLRNLNDSNTWSQGCWGCQSNELSSINSFRKSMLDAFGKQKNLSGPKRIDLLFDTSCNLACRICGPSDSTFWQKHLKENNIKFPTRYNDTSRTDEMIALLQTLDLSNLEQIQFCGGETLMGNNYWRVADIIASMVPNAKEKLLLGFQTNGTQPIDPRFYEIIEKFKLVKLFISIDGVNDKFEYLRWPANWSQVTENILQLREQLPVNVMYLFEETVCVLNLFYHDDVEKWIEKNFPTNRLGDPVNHSKHLANFKLELSNITKEYLDAMNEYDLKNLVPRSWQENPQQIKSMIAEINQFDKIRNQSWVRTFPEVAEFYSRYL